MPAVQKQGRAAPGPKGAQTRARLMEAARGMLRTVSPLELTAIAISRAAGTAPPSFYVYFPDVRGLMLALADDAADSLIALADAFETPWPPQDIEGWARVFVERVIDVWHQNAEILAYRNLEADRGDRAFDESRVRASLPLLTGLTDRMLAAHPPETRPRRVEAFAESVIIYAGMERLAATSRIIRADRLKPHHYVAAFGRMIANATRPRSP